MIKNPLKLTARNKVPLGSDTRLQKQSSEGHRSGKGLWKKDIMLKNPKNLQIEINDEDPTPISTDNLMYPAQSTNSKGHWDGTLPEINGTSTEKELYSSSKKNKNALNRGTKNYHSQGFGDDAV